SAEATIATAGCRSGAGETPSRDWIARQGGRLCGAGALYSAQAAAGSRVDRAHSASSKQRNESQRSSRVAEEGLSVFTYRVEPGGRSTIGSPPVRCCADLLHQGDNANARQR